MIKTSSWYKWYILALATCTHLFVVALPFFCMPVLFKQISEDLSLSLVQLGVVWGMISLPSLFAAFGAGLISDRFGASRTLAISCLLAGAAGALRGVADGFTTLALFMFLFGLFAIPLQFTTHKAAGEWFTGRQLGLANGILAMGMGIGNTLGSMLSATVLSPAFGGWRNLLFVYGAIGIVIGILWLRARRRPRQHEEARLLTIETVPFKQSLSHVIRLKPVWLLALFQLCIMAYMSGFIGYLPLYLRDVAGWSPVSADGALAALCAISVIGVIPLSMISDRLGLRKAVLFPAIFAAFIGISLLSLYTGPAIWVAMFLIGIGQEAFFALSITMVMETEGVGSAYAGTALGMATTLAALGGFFSPPIGNRLAEINPSFAFVFWAAISLCAFVILFFVAETGWKKRPIPADIAGTTS